MESDRILEDLLTLSRRQVRLLEEIRDLLAALRPGEGRPVPVRGVREEPHDLA